MPPLAGVLPLFFKGHSFRGHFLINLVGIVCYQVERSVLPAEIARNNDTVGAECLKSHCQYRSF